MDHGQLPWVTVGVMAGKATRGLCLPPVLCVCESSREVCPADAFACQNASSEQWLSLLFVWRQPGAIWQEIVLEVDQLSGLDEFCSAFTRFLSFTQPSCTGVQLAGKAGQQMLGAFLKLLSEPTSNIPQEWEAPPPPFSVLRPFVCRHIPNLVFFLMRYVEIGYWAGMTLVWGASH